MPFFPAVMKYSTSSSIDFSRTSIVLPLAGGCSPHSRPLASAPVGRVRERLHHDFPGDNRNVAAVRQQRPVFRAGDEIDADGVRPRVSARSILHVQRVTVVILVALHG